MLACPYCTEPFSSRDELVDHLTDSHDAYTTLTDIVMEVGA